MHQTSRRYFLTGSARAAAGVIGLSILSKSARAKSAPGERVRVAVMGVRGRGDGLESNHVTHAVPVGP